MCVRSAMAYGSETWAITAEQWDIEMYREKDGEMDVYH